MAYLWVHFKVIWPSVLSQLILFVLLCGVAGWVWRKLHPLTSLKLHHWLMMGLFVSAGYWLFHFTGVHTDIRLRVAQAEDQLRQQQAVAQFNEKKGNFIKAIENLVASAPSISDDIKKQMLTQFPEFLSSNEVKATVGNSLFTAFMCQKFYLEDLQAALKSKKFTKSPDRAKCETYDGVFFGREKLITPEIAKSNDESIQKAGTDRRLPASKNADSEADQKQVTETIEAQKRAIENLRVLFQ